MGVSVLFSFFVWLVDGEDWCVGVSDYVFGDASDDDSLDAFSGVCSHYDEVWVDLLFVVYDGGVWVSDDYFGGWFEVMLLCECFVFVDEFLCVFV